VTHRGPCQPRTFCDSVESWGYHLSARLRGWFSNAFSTPRVSFNGSWASSTRFFNPRWLRKSRFPRVGSICHSSGVTGSRGWKTSSFWGPARDGTANPWCARPSWGGAGGKRCQPEHGETKTEGLPWRCWLAHILRPAEQPQRLAMEVESAEKLQFAGNSGQRAGNGYTGSLWQRGERWRPSRTWFCKSFRLSAQEALTSAVKFPPAGQSSTCSSRAGAGAALSCLPLHPGREQGQLRRTTDPQPPERFWVIWTTLGCLAETQGLQGWHESIWPRFRSASETSLRAADAERCEAGIAMWNSTISTFYQLCTPRQW